MVRHNDVMEGIIMGLHFMFLIAENIMTYSGEPQSQSAALVYKWLFESARATEGSGEVYLIALAYHCVTHFGTMESFR